MLTEESVSGIKDGRLPAHNLQRRVGAPIIALRSITTEGIGNGTRMVVTKTPRNSISARVLHGPKKDQTAPRRVRCSSHVLTSKLSRQRYLRRPGDHIRHPNLWVNTRTSRRTYHGVLGTLRRSRPHPDWSPPR